MKNLLQKSLKQLSIYAFIVFALSIPSYFLMVDWIWLKELDENNHILANRIANEFNDLQVSPEKIDESIQFWNEIQPVSQIQVLQTPLLKDSIYTITRQNPYTKEESIDRFRGLLTNIQIKEKNYLIRVETNVEETEETVVYLAMVSLIFFLILIIGFWILNRRLSIKLWEPFQNTLQKIKNFKLNQQQAIEFEKNEIVEFTELNQTLDKLIQHSISTYKNQKEFTENASHEIQTPLAILKNKLDILLQSEDLTERQYHLVEEMNQALTRSARINKNLLLIAKLENSQFDQEASLSFDQLLQQIILSLEEYFQPEALRLVSQIDHDVILKGNTSLCEILITNLILNAIRHGNPDGLIKIKLDHHQFEIRNSGKRSLDATNLFKRFNRASSVAGGTGLGLSIVHQICKLHGWTLNYQFLENQHQFTVQFSQF